MKKLQVSYTNLLINIFLIYIKLMLFAKNLVDFDKEKCINWNNLEERTRRRIKNKNS